MLLTDLYRVAPRALTRWLYARLGLTAGAHDWLCDAGLCPCGTYGEEPTSSSVRAAAAA